MSSINKWVVLHVADEASRKRNGNFLNLNIKGREKKLAWVVSSGGRCRVITSAFSAKFNNFGSFGQIYSQKVLLEKFRFLHSRKCLVIYSLFINAFLLGLMSFGISSCETFINLINFFLNFYSLWRMYTSLLTVHLHNFRSLKKKQFANT